MLRSSPWACHGFLRRPCQLCKGSDVNTSDDSQSEVIVPGDDDKIEITHRWLTGKKKAIEADLSVHAAEIGEFLIETFFDGNVALACSHSPRKHQSLRRLCDHNNAPFSLSALRTFIQVAQNFRVIPHDQAARLPPSHHALLYRVANPEERADLARQCAEDRTSARTLREMVKGRGRRRPGAGRKPRVPTSNEVRVLRSRVEAIIRELDTAQPTEIDSMIVELRSLRDAVARSLDRLGDLRAKTPTAE